ncbi:hypothetical protein GCM10023116_31020 [Kistimonas scapharcae]|uniref:Transposase n=1 Tax=Kistimonas scapharcae TaxID=1036133 RepID=A0ABP8V5Z1_9GAMM
MKQKTPEGWFQDLVVDGVQGLIVLSLPRTPAMEIIDATVLQWVEVLWAAPVDWSHNQDAKRMRDAFTRLKYSATEWPTPRQYLELLGNRNTNPLRLPKHRTEDEIRVGQQQLSRLKGMVGGLLADVQVGQRQVTARGKQSC